LQSGVADVFLGKRHDRAQVQNFRVQRRARFGERDGIGARAAAHVEHVLGVVDAGEPCGFFGIVLRARMHGRDERARARLGKTLGTTRDGGFARLHAFGERRPRIQKMNHVQKARARGRERLRFVRAVKHAVALEQGAHSHEGIEQHLGSASIRAQLRRKPGGRSAFPERSEHVQLEGREQHAAFLKGPAGLHQTL